MVMASGIGRGTGAAECHSCCSMSHRVSYLAAQANESLL